VEHYDILAIGGGTAGLVTAAGAAGLGARAALIERARMGGDCLWFGCVPSKALLASARAVRDARRAAHLGVVMREVAVDFPRVMARVREAQERIQPHDSPERFRELGVEVVLGTARFTSEDVVTVDGRRISARHIVIATGSRPSIPAIAGLESVPYLTNESVFNLEQLPASLAIIGGGPIGLELGQALALLGCAVTIVEGLPRIAAEEDEEMAALLRAALESDGVAIRTGAPVASVEPAGAGVALCAGGVRLEVERLLVATGRSPAVAGLELDAAGVEAGPNGIVVDRRLRTTAPRIWAAGDVVGPLRFTHVADYQARLVLRNALFPFSRSVDYAAVPRVIYTEPELARIGLTEAEAREQHGDDVRVWRRPFADADRAIADERTEGMVKLVANRRGRLLGAHILGHGAGSMIGQLALAMRNGLGLARIAETILPYPTYPEAVRQAAELQQRERLHGLTARIVRSLVRR
jgi:pyruvate/2-oxoglutarate dehydrogenase complex dihydrolipoamide dehydrogenase (E3) component